MNKIFAIAGKELKAYFKSPIAYVVLIITISVFNIFFFLIIDGNREASLRDVFKVMEFLFIFIVPLLTMKTFAEEKSSGTMEFLMTTPTTNTAIVLGKYLGSLIFFTLIIAITLSYYFIIEFFSNPERLETLIGYVGIWLEGAFFIAIGVLASSWTKNQIIAAISSYVILFLLYFSMSFIKYFSGSLETLVRYIGAWSHAENFTVGLISMTDLVYYVSGILICILFTRLSIENRLWH
ncbi:MAG: ABC transporter permease [Candidatus Omnitrophica bacterium]|nr:ABC transporter permease [Candidatus Omnitrophota bacterium]MBU0879013.1 ABC transporter permease [Candidatus Omnitrophota bacterium]MBU0896306.1 ABC transporter permease [Candidatus Omnitrophota bacterium]MBU1133484.1 ABC transporter permease [Candidatus Omnitrophota bacterium]MBU1810080.1 ABC transporter permease [Candidatus Omnitrophota bacterium]